MPCSIWSNANFLDIILCKSSVHLSCTHNAAQNTFDWQTHGKICGVEQIKCCIWILNQKHCNKQESMIKSFTLSVTGSFPSGCGCSLKAESEAGSWWPGLPCGSWWCSGSGSPRLWVWVVPWERLRPSHCLWTWPIQSSLNPSWSGGGLRGCNQGCCSHSCWHQAGDADPALRLSNSRMIRCLRRGRRSWTRCLYWSYCAHGRLSLFVFATRSQREHLEIGPCGDAQAHLWTDLQNSVVVCFLHWCWVDEKPEVPCWLPGSEWSYAAFSAGCKGLPVGCCMVAGTWTGCNLPCHWIWREDYKEKEIYFNL